MTQTKLRTHNLCKLFLEMVISCFNFERIIKQTAAYYNATSGNVSKRKVSKLMEEINFAFNNPKGPQQFYTMQCNQIYAPK